MEEETREVMFDVSCKASEEHLNKKETESLSEKEVKLDMCDCDKECYWPEEVREAVLRLKKELSGENIYDVYDMNTSEAVIELIDEIFGEKLT